MGVIWAANQALGNCCLFGIYLRTSKWKHLCLEFFNNFVKTNGSKSEPTYSEAKIQAAGILGSLSLGFHQKEANFLMAH